MRREMIGIYCFLQSLASLIDTGIYATEEVSSLYPFIRKDSASIFS
jgi:hypothetical protein